MIPLPAKSSNRKAQAAGENNFSCRAISFLFSAFFPNFDNFEPSGPGEPKSLLDARNSEFGLLQPANPFAEPWHDKIRGKLIGRGMELDNFVHAFPFRDLAPD